MSVHRLLNRILRDEERADRIEANLNVHLQSYAKNVGKIQDDFSRVVEKIIATGSGEGEPSELEYVNEEEGSGSGLSYHSPTVAQEEVPLLVFGEVLPGDTQSLPVEVQETCGCPVPTVIRIEDDVKMVAAPRENNTPIPVPPRQTVRNPRASCGVTKAYFRSSTRRTNRHAM